MIRRITSFVLAFLLIFSVVLPVIAASDNGDTIVYRTRTGSKYHREYCSYLKSKYEITLRDAVERGLTPCSRCNPPRFNGTLTTERTTPANEKQPSVKTSPSVKNTEPTEKTISTTKSASSKSTYTAPSKNTQKERGSLSFGTWVEIIILGSVLLFRVGLWIWAKLSENWAYTPDGKRIKHWKKK